MNKLISKNIIAPLAILVAVLVLTIGGVFAYSEYGRAEEALNTATTVNQNKSSNLAKEKQAVNDDHIKYIATTEGSALDQLMAINQTVQVEESEYGKLVNAINDKVGGTDGKYWTFYIDGKMAPVGADTYKPEGGEMIEWKFQSL